MTAIINIDMDSLRRLAFDTAPVLLDAAVKGLVLLGVAWGLARAMRRASAATRQMVWLLALAALLALPLASAALPSWGVLPDWVKIEMAPPAATPVPAAPIETDTMATDTTSDPAAITVPPSTDPIRGADRVEPFAAAPPWDDDESFQAPSVALAPEGAPWVAQSEPYSANPGIAVLEKPNPGRGALEAANTQDAAEEQSPPIAAATSVTAPVSSAAPWSSRIIPALVAVWLAGTILCLLPLILGRISLWLLARRATRVDLDSSAWGALVRRAAKTIGLRGPITLLQSRDEPMPMIWGTLRPTLLLPAEADGWSAQRGWVVLLHELAHAKRHDCLAKLVAHVACALYWFNPLAWIAFKLMQREAESACDDLVLASSAATAKTGGDIGVKPSDYAQHLLEIASGLKSGALAPYSSIAMARKSKLEGRLLAILDATRNRRAMTRIGLLVVAVLVAAVALPLAVLKASGPDEEKLITKPGDYTSPGGTCRVVITLEQSEKPELDGIYYLFSNAILQARNQTMSGGISPLKPGWCMVWDKQDNLWIFNPRTPNEGVRVRVHQAATDRVLAPGASGGWDGVPAAFLAKLPEEIKDDHAYATRKFPDVGVFINNHRYGPSNGGLSYPADIVPKEDQTNFTTKVTNSSMSNGHPGAVSKVEWKFLRTTDKGDEYEVTRYFPFERPSTQPSTKPTATPKPVTKTVTYNGKPVVVFEDDVQRVWLLTKADHKKIVEGLITPPPLQSDPADLVGAKLSMARSTFSVGEPLLVYQSWTSAMNWKSAIAHDFNGTTPPDGHVAQSDDKGLKFWRVRINDREYRLKDPLLFPSRGWGTNLDLRTTLIDGPDWKPGHYRVQYLARDLPVIRLADEAEGTVITPRVIASNEVRFEITDASIPQPGVFGPTVERVLTPDDADEQGYMFFDFETGKSYKPPFALKMFGQLEMTPELLGWVKSTGVDLLIRFGDKDKNHWWQTIIGLEWGLNSGTWEAVTPRDVTDAFARRDGAGTPRHRIEAPGTAFADFKDPDSREFPSIQSSSSAFRTATNTLGVMQLYGTDKPSRAVTIRYRILQDLPTTKPATQPARRGESGDRVTLSYTINTPVPVGDDGMSVIWVDRDHGQPSVGWVALPTNKISSFSDFSFMPGTRLNAEGRPLVWIRSGTGDEIHVASLTTGDLAEWIETLGRDATDRQVGILLPDAELSTFETVWRTLPVEDRDRWILLSHGKMSEQSVACVKNLMAEIAAEHAAAPPTAFWPVRTKVLRYVSGYRDDSAISFEQNKLLSPTADLGPDYKQREKLGADAWLNETGQGQLYIGWGSTRIFEVPNRFDTMKPNELRKLIDTTGGREVQGIFLPDKSLTKTYAFMTGTSQMGLLQIRAVSTRQRDNRREVTLQYKLLRRGVEADKIVATVTPVALDTPETWQWRVTCDVPVRIIEGFVFEKGLTHGDGGDWFPLDNEVEFSVVRKDGKLFVARSVQNSTTGEKETTTTPLITETKQTTVTRSSRVEHPMELSEDAALTVTYVSPAIQLTTDKPMKLWEGEFRDGDGPPQRVIFAARIEAHDTPKGKYGAPLDPRNEVNPRPETPQSASQPTTRPVTAGADLLPEADLDGLCGEITLTLGWSGQQVTVPGPLLWPEEGRKTAEYLRWQRAKDMRTLNFTDSAGRKWQASAMTNNMPEITVHRKDGTLLAKGMVMENPVQWYVYDAGGENPVLTVYCRDNVNEKGDRIGGWRVTNVIRHEPDGTQYEWDARSNTAGVVYSEAVSLPGESRSFYFTAWAEPYRNSDQAYTLKLQEELEPKNVRDVAYGFVNLAWFKRDDLQARLARRVAADSPLAKRVAELPTLLGGMQLPSVKDVTVEGDTARVMLHPQKDSTAAPLVLHMVKQNGYWLAANLESAKENAAGQQATQPASAPPNELPPSGTLGRVVDVHGKGVAGAVLSSASPRWTVTTDANGQFPLPQLDESTHLTLTIRADGYAPRGLVPLWRNADGEYANKGVYELHRMGRLEGTVLGPDGKPLAAAPLSVTTTEKYPNFSSMTSNHHRGITDAQGRFSIDVVPGRVLLYYPWSGPTSGEVQAGTWAAWTKPGQVYPSAPIEGVYAFQRIELDDGQVVKGLVLDLSRSTAAVEGRVLDRTGRTVPNAKISPISKGGEGWMQFSPYYPSAVTDANGQYRLERLPAGAWHIKARFEDSEAEMPVELSENKTALADVQMKISVEELAAKTRPAVRPGGATRNSLLRGKVRGTTPDGTSFVEYIGQRLFHSGTLSISGIEEPISIQALGKTVEELKTEIVAAHQAQGLRGVTIELTIEEEDRPAPASQPASQPAVKPVAQPTTRPATPPATRPALRLGPVVEITFSPEDADGNGIVFLDIESGQIVKPPFELTPNINGSLHVDVTPELRKWFQTSSADMMLRFNKHDYWTMHPLAMNVARFNPPIEWDDVTPRDIVGLFEDAKFDTRHEFPGGGGNVSSTQRTTHAAFRTLDDTFGLMHLSAVTGTSNLDTTPRVVTLRYRKVLGTPVPTTRPSVKQGVHTSLSTGTYVPESGATAIRIAADGTLRTGWAVRDKGDVDLGDFTVRVNRGLEADRVNVRSRQTDMDQDIVWLSLGDFAEWVRDGGLTSNTSPHAARVLLLPDGELTTIELVWRSLPAKDIYQWTLLAPGKLSDNALETLKALAADVVDADLDTFVTLPGGAELELVAVSRYPDKNQPFWRPDGSELTLPLPFDTSDGDITSYVGNDVEKYQLVFRVGGQAGPGNDAMMVRPDNGAAWWTGARNKEGKYAENLAVFGISVPTGTRTLNLDLHIAAGLWQVEGTSDGKKAKGNLSAAQRNPHHTEPSAMIFARADRDANDVRVMAVDTELTRHFSRIVGERDQGEGLEWEFTFPGLPLDRIASYTFQTRPYETIHLKDISLAPGRTTTPVLTAAPPPAAPRTKPRVGIYLVTAIPTKPPSRTGTPLSDWILADEPLLDERDIVEYDWDTHTVRLKTQQAADRVLKREFNDDLVKDENGNVLLKGGSFVVVVNGQRLFYGMLIPSTKQALFLHSPTIMIGDGTVPLYQPPMTVRIFANTSSGVPSQPDLRPDPRLKSALEALGVLRESATGQASRQAGGTLEFRVAPRPEDLLGKDMDIFDGHQAAFRRFLENGRVSIPTPGRDQEFSHLSNQLLYSSYVWMPMSDKLELPGCVTGEYKGQQYVLVSIRPGETMAPGEGAAWGLADVKVTKDKDRSVIAFDFDDRGSARFTDLTTANLGRAMAIVIDGKVVSAPVIQAVIGKSGQITGDFTEPEAAAIADALRTGMATTKPTTQPTAKPATQPATQPAAAAKPVDSETLGKLADAIAKGQVSTVKKLLASNPELVGGRMNLPRGVAQDATPLHQVAGMTYYYQSGLLGTQEQPITPDVQKRLLEIATTLLDAGADINAFSEGGNISTPLHLAVKRQVLEGGWTGMAELLLQRGADPNLLYSNYQTPLHLAADFPHSLHLSARLSIVKTLLKHGADPCILGGFGGKWPYEHAVEQKYAEIAEALEKPTKDRADAEAIVLGDVAKKWAKAILDNDDKAIAALTADDLRYYPLDWAKRAANYRQTYAAKPAALGTIVSVGWREPWAVVQVAGAEKETSVLLTLMRFPDGQWRIVCNEEFATDKDFKSDEAAEHTNIVIGPGLLNGTRSFSSYRDAVLDKAGLLPLPRRGQEMGVTSNNALVGLEVFIRDGRLILVDTKYRSTELEVDEAWVKRRRLHTLGLDICGKFKEKWEPKEGTQTTLTIANGRAVIEQNGQTIELQRDGDRVRVIQDGETTLAARLTIGGDLSVSEPTTQPAKEKE